MPCGVIVIPDHLAEKLADDVRVLKKRLGKNFILEVCNMTFLQLILNEYFHVSVAIHFACKVVIRGKGRAHHRAHAIPFLPSAASPAGARKNYVVIV